MCSKMGNKNGERRRGHDLQEVGEDTGFVQFKGDLITVYSFLMMRIRDGGADLPSDW